MTTDDVAALFADTDRARAELDREFAKLKASLVESKPPPAPTVRRLAAIDLLHVRAFRLPREQTNGQGFDFGGKHLALAWSPAMNRHTLFVMNNGGYVAEITIPTEDGAFAEYVQGFVEAMDAHTRFQVSPDGNPMMPGGMLVVGDRLLVTPSIYYDANGTQRKSHFTLSRDLSKPDRSPVVSVGDPLMTGFVAGYLAHVPAEWVDRLRGMIVTGQFGIPIVTRTSWGPAAFAMLPLIPELEQNPATPLVYYPGDHPTLGSWEGSNPVYGGTATCGGLVIIDDTALFFGRNGTGPFCYGNGTSNPVFAAAGPDGEPYCYDPASSNKGQHAYPYRYQVWAYDLHDFAAVAAGTKRPWEIVPQVWPLELPTPEHEFRGIGGVAYHPATRELYVSQLNADPDGYAYRALIHVFTVNTA